MQITRMFHILSYFDFVPFLQCLLCQYTFPFFFGFSLEWLTKVGIISKDRCMCIGKDDALFSISVLNLFKI